MIFSMSIAKEFFRSTKQNKNAVSRMSSVLKSVADRYHQKTQAASVTSSTAYCAALSSGMATPDCCRAVL